MSATPITMRLRLRRRRRAASRERRRPEGAMKGEVLIDGGD
ncbi:MAG: hypothetical protein ACHQE6_02790 [Solirubrobacterales bacterium]